MPADLELKADAFGQILLRRSQPPVVVRDLTKVRWWAWPIARFAAGREARALARLDGIDGVAQLHGFDGRKLVRSYIEGQPMHEARPRDPAFYRQAHGLLKRVRARGVVHNDLAKEANWIVTTDGAPALTDFQLATFGSRQSRRQRLFAREDLRHLLKHKRMYCPTALTPTEHRLLARPSWLRQWWFATLKPVYQWLTRRVLHWQDNEGRGSVAPSPQNRRPNDAATASDKSS